MKPTAAAMAVASAIYAREPYHKYDEENIIAAALIADKYMIPREVPHHSGNTTDHVADIRDPVRDARNSEEPDEMYARLERERLDKLTSEPPK